MATRVASLYAEITANTTGFTKGATQVKTDLGNLGKQAGTTSASLGNLYKAAAGSAAILALGKAFKFSIDQAAEQERIMAATEAVIRSTGGIAGLTAREIGNMAGQMSRLTSIDDEVIQGGQNMLLTFKGIGEDAFPRATAAMMDMAVAFNNGSTVGLDLTSTAVTLGKALNDPLLGLTMLTRQGVQFTQSQKDAIAEMVAMNDIAGAQNIILTELESQFGGAAEAAGDTFAGAMEKAKNSLGNFAAEVGAGLLPGLEKIATGFSEFLDNQTSMFAGQSALNIALESGNITWSEWMKLTNAVKAGLGEIPPEVQKIIDQQVHIEEVAAGYRELGAATQAAAAPLGYVVESLLKAPTSVNTRIQIDMLSNIPIDQLMTLLNSRDYVHNVAIIAETVGNTGLRATGTGSGKDYTSLAGGGPIAGATEVGEQGREWIVNGVVLPNDMVRRMRAWGLTPGSFKAGGGSLNTPLLDGAVGTSGVQAGITNTNFGMGTGMGGGSGAVGGGGSMSGAAGGASGGRRGDPNAGSTSAALAAAAQSVAVAAASSQQVAASAISAQQQANNQAMEQMTASVTASFESSSQQVTAAIDALRNDMRVFTEALPTEMASAVQLGA